MTEAAKIREECLEHQCSSLKPHSCHMAELQPAVGVDSDAWTEVTSGRRAALKTMLDNENYSHSAPQAGVSEASPSPSWSLIGFPHPQLPGGL